MTAIMRMRIFIGLIAVLSMTWKGEGIAAEVTVRAAPVTTSNL